MFNILQRYLFKKLLLSFIGITILCIGIFIITTLFDNLDDFLRAEDTSLFTFILYFLYDIPFTFQYIYPISVMFSLVYVIGKLNEQNELITMYNTGISIYKLIFPFIIFIFILSSIFSVFNKEIFFESHRKSREAKQVIKKRFNRSKTRIRKNVTTFGSGKKVYFIKRYIPLLQLMDYVHILYLDEKFIFKKLVSARRIQYNTNLNIWEGTNLVIRKWHGDKEKVTKKNYMKLNLQETPAFFKTHERNKEYMSAGECKQLAEKLKTTGGNWQKYMTSFYFKISTPFITFIIIFLSIPIAVIAKRMNLIFSLGIVLFTVFTFLCFNWVGESLGNSGILPPIMAGFFGHSIFSAISYYLWRKFLF
ncbi:MAG TPA: LptF/LptG family permease [Spirochaetota bacterium]|nr:LptF/LptG family permease [Spirochaetota bacterium]